MDVMQLTAKRQLKSSAIRSVASDDVLYFTLLLGDWIPISRRRQIKLPHRRDAAAGAQLTVQSERGGNSSKNTSHWSSYLAACMEPLICFLGGPAAG